MGHRYLLLCDVVWRGGVAADGPAAAGARRGVGGRRVAQEARGEPARAERATGGGRVDRRRQEERHAHAAAGRSIGLTELDILRSRQHPSVSHTPCGALTILI